MARLNSAAFNENIVGARDNAFPYRQGFGLVPSAEWVVFFDDFVSDVASNVPAGWDAAIIDTGCTVTNAGLAGGQILFDSDANNEGAGIYLPKSVKLAGKKVMIECRVKIEDADTTTFQFGLSDLVATTDPEDLWDTSNADGIAFGILDSDVTKLVYDKNNGTPVTETGTISLTDNAFHTLAIVYDGSATPKDGSLRAYVDGQLAAVANTEAQVPEDVELAPFIGFLGETTADQAWVDYFRVVVER